METTTAKLKEIGNRLYEATIIIPESYNDGQPVPYDIIEEIKLEVLEQFGGYTEEQVMGAWIDSEGQVHKEMNLRLTIAMEDSLRLKILALSIGKRLGQIAMYYSFKGEVSIISME